MRPQATNLILLVSLTLCQIVLQHRAHSSYLIGKPLLANQQQHLFGSAPLAAQSQSQPPVINPFAFNQNVQENQRASVLCTISSGDLPVTITWLKDGQPLTQTAAQLKRIIIKPDSDQSTLKVASVRLDHAGNYTCVARNEAGLAAYSAQLVVHGEPRWLREPQHEPIVATRGQTVVVDCQTTGWPKPQQSWQIKTHTQSEFEPLAATGRISLAANGSLVIRNADKSDEANYRCNSANGIGKGISGSTSLKVNVPAHFESSKPQISVVRKQSQVQLRCDAYGDEQITVDWYKNKQRLTNELDARYTIHNKPLLNGLISLLLIKQSQRQDNSLYECIARNSVGKDRLPIELIVQEEPDNIQELQLTKLNSRSVTLVWSEPYDGRSAITNYMFQYKKVHEASPSLAELEFMDSISLDLSAAAATGGSAPGLKPASTLADDWQQASRLMVPVASNSSNGVRSVTIERLEPSSRYVLRALAVNAIGQSKFSQPMEFVTAEEAPELGPANIRAEAVNSTSIQVSWDEIPRSKQLGRIHGYYIGYRVANSSSQSFVYKPYIINDLLSPPLQQQQQLEPSGQMQSAQRLDTVIHDLRRDTLYEITVMAFNSQGSGPNSDFVLCKTIEMEAPRPVKLQIRRESNESIFIEWQREPLDQNPVDDYVLYQEKNSASQEWLQVRLPGNQSQYKAPGLKCGTRYQFYIIAHNKVGKSAPSEVVSASTSGALPMIPSKVSLIKMLNSTCLQVNLNAFQDNGCRIRTFTVRYRVEKSSAPNGSSLVSSNGFAATHQALSAAGQLAGKTAAALAAPTPDVGSEWINIRPKSNLKHQRANEEDRIEYLCELSPVGEYTIHVAAANDVGRSEIAYTVLMSSDELRYSPIRELVELVAQLPTLLSYIPSFIVFLFAALLLALLSLILYTSAVKYYQKFLIMQNQMRAQRRAKQDERRRRKLNSSSRLSQKTDWWADEYDDDDDGDDDDGDDEHDDDDDDDGRSSAGSSRRELGRHRCAPKRPAAGHYLANMAANSAFDSSSIDSPCNKHSAGSCMSTASSDSMQGRFQCLSNKQYVKMNEYTMLPSISASLSPPSDVYGTTGLQTVGANNPLYYSTLRRTNMQTYLPQQPPQQQQQQAQPQHPLSRRSQNLSDIYGYYLPQNQQQQAAEEAANSIFVPPQQIIYSAPNIRRQPVFL